MLTCQHTVKLATYTFLLILTEKRYKQNYTTKMAKCDLTLTGIIHTPIQTVHTSLREQYTSKNIRS